MKDWNFLLDGGEVGPGGGRFVRGGGLGKVAGEEAAVFAALFEVHVHDFEGHVLSAIIAHHGGGLHLAQADLQAQLK